MKLWSSFVKELLIASRGFYFYVEIGMALVLLFVLLFVVPENFNNKEDEFLYLAIPQTEIRAAYLDSLDDLDGQPVETLLKVGKDEISAQLYETESSDIYVLANESDMVRLAEDRHKIGAAVVLDENDGQWNYTYYLQGNETPRLKGLISILHGQDDAKLFDAADNQVVHSLESNQTVLSDRENLLPVFLAFNGSLMGFFIIAAYIFLDKMEGVVKAYAVSPSPVWQYLLSKVMVLTLTMLVTSLLMVVPLMGMRVNYMILIAFLLTTGLFASGLGLVISGYFDDMSQSFAALFILMISLMLPVLSYFSPSWNPLWLKFIPSYHIIFGFQAIFTKSGNGYVLTLAAAFLAAGVLLFVWANARMKRTLSV